MFRSKKLLLPFITLAMMLLFVCGTAYADSSNVIIAYDKSTSGPGGGWHSDENGVWTYQKDGVNLANCWEQIDGKWYRFGENGSMLTGWQTIGDAQYYLTETEAEGHPVGSCYISETTPDGCTVDEEGRMIRNPALPTQGIERANPYGTETCVEIVLSEQQIYVYQGAQLVIVSPCVTGSVYGGHATPTGRYKIFHKERNRTLRGTNNNGTKYAAFVNFWMPFNGGIGLHDANWRSSFGGDLYVSGGSHGCVNMPYDKAEALYSIAYVGMPVYVHN